MFKAQNEIKLNGLYFSLLILYVGCILKVFQLPNIA